MTAAGNGTRFLCAPSLIRRICSRGLGCLRAGSLAFYVAGTAMLLTVLAVWWSYVDWLFRVGERALKAATGLARGRLARNAYSVAHYPLVASIEYLPRGVRLTAYGGDATDLPARVLQGFLDAVATGDAHVPIHRTYQPDDIALAHQDMEGGRATGKLVVIP